MKLSLFDVSIVADRVGQVPLQQALTFLIKNTADTVLSPEQMSRVIQTRLFSNTPMSKIYQDLVEADKLNSFVCINLSGTADDVPEVLTIQDIVIDGKAIPSLPVPARFQKCWINLTPISTKIDPYNAQYNITDATQLANLVVRAALVTGYEDNQLWLSPKLSSFVIESYATTIGCEMSRIYGLDFNESMFIQTLFAAYFAQLLGGETAPNLYPALLNRCTFLGTANDIMQRLQLVADLNTRQDKLWTPDVICTAIQQRGPHRMKKVSKTQLYRFLSSSSVDSITMAIALEYPPYWVYQLLKVASGAKIPTLSNVIKLRNMKGKIMQFATEMVGSGAIINKVKRDRP